MAVATETGIEGIDMRDGPEDWHFRIAPDSRRMMCGAVIPDSWTAVDVPSSEVPAPQLCGECIADSWTAVDVPSSEVPAPQLCGECIAAWHAYWQYVL